MMFGKAGAKLKRLLKAAPGKRVDPRRVAVLVGGLLLVTLLAGVGWHFLSSKPSDAGNYPEVVELAAQDGPKSYREYVEYFKKLADDKGAPYAYAVALRAEFTPGTDLHLLAHVIGDKLYLQEGIEGIKYCTSDFRNACSHAIVVGALTEKGEGALPEIAQACERAPGGRGAYTMCYHGLGHGVLAYLGYDLKQAVLMCKKVGTQAHNNREYVECVGGTIMEMVAGVNDRAAWEKQVGNYFTAAAPLSPCDTDWMPQEARTICYTYLTPHLFRAAGGDLNNIDPKVYPKAFSFCDGLAEDDASDRAACFGGFGKEFVVSAQGRDVRDVGAMPQDRLELIRSWCAMAGNAKGEATCNSTALASLFWGGENKPDASFAFCAIAAGPEQGACYGQIASMISYYGTPQTSGALCARLPEAYRAQCAPRTARQ